MLQLHLAVFLFGVSGIIGKLLDLPSISIVFGRTFIATLTLLVLVKVRGTKLTAPHFLWKSIPSGFLLALHWVTFFKSIQVSSVAVGLLSFSTFPVFVTFLDPLCSRSKLSFRDLAIALVVFAGLVLVVPSFELGNRAFSGMLWGLVSGFSFAVLTIWNRQLVQKVDALQIGLFQNFWATIALLPFVQSLTAVTPTQALLLIFLGVFCTAVAHWCFIAALRSVRSQVASITTSLEPVYGIFFATIILGEIPTMRECLGGVIILTTVAYSAWNDPQSH